jgi:GNAT superfamily N-acetyltransferase
MEDDNMSGLEFKLQSREELFPFTRTAFKKSLEPSLVCDVDEIVGRNQKYHQLKNDCLKSQKRFDLGIYFDGEQIGSFMGRHSGKGIFRMGTSVILPDHQGKGHYSKLLNHIVDWASSEGFWAIESNHSPCNNRIISIKLNKGFYISGFDTTLHVGNIVRLTRFLDPEHEQLFKFRNGFVKPNNMVRRLFDF